MGLSLEELFDTDIIEEVNGISVAYEESIYPHTRSLALEYQETSRRKGLVLTGNENSQC